MSRQSKLYKKINNQVEEHSNKNNNQIKDSKTGEVSNHDETELINMKII